MIISGEYGRKDKLNKIVINHLKAEEKLLDLLYSEDVDYDIFLKDVKNLLDVRRDSHKKLGFNPDTYSEIKMNLVKEKEIPSDIVDSFNEMKSHLSHIIHRLNQNEIPVLNINIITNFINLFNKYGDSNTENLKINTKINTVLIDTKSHNIRLNTGKNKILLTPRNTDLTDFSQDELVEILRVLDVISKDDTYDYLKAEIVDQISNISSISFID